MKFLHLALLVLSFVAAPPLSAQDSVQSPRLSPESPAPATQFLDEITRLFREFMGQVEPHVRELEPLLEDMRQRLEAIGSYYPPEILPNGDILIRRRLPVEGEPLLDKDPEPRPEPRTEPEDQPDADGTGTGTDVPFEL